MERLFERYAAAWAANDAEAIASHWDSVAFRFYKAEEVERVFYVWDEALAYWRGNQAMHERVRLDFSDQRPIPLDAAWRLMFVRMRWSIRFAAAAPPAVAGKAMGGDNHVLALLHGERFAGWSETPDAPISYVRRLYETQAREV